MNNPYQDNPMWEDMQPGYLIPGDKYDLVINKVPYRPENLPVPLLTRDMEFIRHDMHPNTHEFQDMYILKFKYGENNYTMIVENTPLNKIYRLRKVSDQMKEPVITYINNNTTEPNKTKIVNDPGTSAHILFNKYGINDPLLQNYMGNFGGKRKNNKKKTQSKKKTAGKKAKSVRKKSKSLKKNRKTKKTKKN
tara:strand:+ start:823 stop:1401 length:579 start_codon:yes stop_codon:yes gene_type:complete